MQLPGLFFFRIDGSVLQTFLFESILVCQYIRDIREGRLGIVIKTGLVGIFFLVKYSTPYSSIYAVFALAITKGLSLSQFRLSPTSISQLQGCQGSISFLFASHPLGFSSKWFWETETGGRGRASILMENGEGGLEFAQRLPYVRQNGPEFPAKSSKWARHGGCLPWDQRGPGRLEE